MNTSTGTKRKSTRRTKKAKSMTIEEFRSMLNGMDLINGGDDWVPDEEQWKKIRECIENIKEPEPVVHLAVERNEPATPNTPMQQPQPRQPQQGSSFEQNRMDHSHVSTLEKLEQPKMELEGDYESPFV